MGPEAIKEEVLIIPPDLISPEEDAEMCSRDVGSDKVPLQTVFLRLSGSSVSHHTTKYN